MEELKKENICVIKDTEMTDDQKTFITSFYRNKLNGSTTPLFLNGARPLDDQTDEDIYLAIRLLRKDETGKIKRERLCGDRITHRRIRSFYPIAGLGGENISDVSR